MSDDYEIVTVESVIPGFVVTSAGSVEVLPRMAELYKGIDIGDEILIGNVSSGKPIFLSKLRSDPRVETGEYEDDKK